ncbi:MAG: EamA family transporter [Phocaeicola sp.]|nr:DMT family transporter [Phocaeicola sp.]MDD7448474.1 EamA family transporter [Prevotellaceae bacterium]MDY5939853.1 EamA family transporter [Phocaeicola sp.]
MTENNHNTMTPQVDKKRKILFHLLIAFATIVWGTTFVSTRYLLADGEGFGPVEIMLYRFLIAYICMVAVSHKKLFADTWKDELLLIVTALLGGSFYFVLQNIALTDKDVNSSIVAILGSTAPLMTIFLAYFFRKEKLYKTTLIGSVIALIGVGIIVFYKEEQFTFKIGFAETLILIASFFWAIYSLLLEGLSKKYSTAFMTRKVFFYSIISMIFYLPFLPIDLKVHLLLEPVFIGNLLYLGVVASFLCFFIWSCGVPILGSSKASNYLYVEPFVALFAGALVLGETITIESIIGSILIIGGVALSQRN